MKTVGKILLVILIIIVALVVIINAAIILGQNPKLRSAEQLADEVSSLTQDLQADNSVKQDSSEYECIMVLGAAVYPDGTPSPMLKDRLDMGIQLYRAGVAPRIIMSGDNTSDRETYDEVENMKAYAVAAGVPSEDIFCDHAGLNTYDSAYRLYYVFGVERAVVVSQRYHLYRALFDTASFGINAVGVPADRDGASVRFYYRAREAAARVSDCIKVLTRQNATYLSEPVGLNQSGDVTTW